MPRYIVTEVVQYEVMAENETEAEEFIEDDEDRDSLCLDVVERSAERARDQTPTLKRNITPTE